VNLCDAAGEGPPKTLDIGSIAIDQVSKYSTYDVVYQEDGSWQAHFWLAKMQAAYGYWSHCFM
jgi:uncharacterized cupin superfamily protein